MSSTHSLEAERDAILSKMQASREHYRRMLMDNSDARGGSYMGTSSHSAYGGNGAAGTSSTAHAHHAGTMPAYERSSALHGGAGDMAAQAMRWAKEHPLLTAAVIAAAVVAVGPRRIVHTVENAASSGGAMATKLRDPSTVDNLTKLLTTLTTVITTAANFLQQVRDTPRR